MYSFNIHFHLILENLIFFVLATSFLGIVGLAWRNALPYSLPSPLPGWFKIWFGTVQILGLLPPLGVLLVWGIWEKNSVVLTVFASYFLMLGLQIITEYLTLRKFTSVVWVMVPYLYLPYRIYQLSEGLTLLNAEPELFWVRTVLILQIILWIGNYALDLAQLPRLFRWEISENQPTS
ncbi:hypothetical protein VB834_21845 [Limnoraphis robusta Tam1]|uniref:SxtJ n=1 Tax=Limnoraphis robusta CCNP1315 TaxID=3110306 RepID=A0ABU5U6X6_9CYAN|nr:hypothetical protein [Limnoraphis robusta]MEA5496648.1 hypothetical protein [Limnoraphis robusta BA-68 BA1]MEA5522947.1 hypothetical protein [Limnoraphis robusta CCNP1315]MEA5541675.1 hypothetical protein [Limnoraphis robusta Tam1]MEA5548659.1 hypothetical protein [Limnoraphis robusta CCNP1324]